MNLNSKLSGTIISPIHHDFSLLALNYNLTYHHTPHLIVYPYNIEDIKAALTYAKSKNLSIKCRAGGCSPVAFSNGNQVVLIDFSKLKSFDFQRENETVTIGAGLLQGELNETLCKLGYHFPGLHYQNISVIGFISGGGIGLSSRYYGLGSDHLIEIKLIDTDGNLVVCNNQLNRDLFWAIRGGGRKSIWYSHFLNIKGIPSKMCFLHRDSV